MTAATFAGRTLEVGFYGRYYPDLSVFDSPEQYERHFRDYGASEGRFANAGEMITALEGEHGTLPEDFEPNEYRTLHEDLADLSTEWELKAHYLNFGRREQRRYLQELGSYEEAYRAFRRERTRDASAEVLPLSFRRLLRSRGLTSVVWLASFHLGEFILLNADWLPARPATRMEALWLFLEEGLDRLAPIGASRRFDPDFYRTGDGARDGTSGPDLYRHWLNEGLVQGEAGSEEALLCDLLGEKQFPACFDSQVYRRALNEAGPLPDAVQALPFDVPAGRARVLAHFIRSGFPAGIRIGLSGAGAAHFYTQVARHYLINGQNALVIEILDEAASLDPSCGIVRHLRGDALTALGRGQEAVVDYNFAASRPNASVWSHIHAAEGLAVLRKSPEAGLDRIVRSAPYWHGTAPWRQAAYRVIAHAFEADGARAHALYREGARAEADALVTRGLARMEAAITAVDPLPARLPPPPRGPVVVVANRDLAQCDHYRVTQKYQQLLHGGWDVEIYDQAHVDAYRPALDRARAVIFYRVAARPAIVHAMLYARALGIPTIYEIDDLIFDSAIYPDPWESFEGQITPTEYAGLQHGVPLFRYAIGLCDVGLASTPALAEAVRPLVRSRICHVLRNGLDARNDRVLAAAPLALAPETVTVFYGSGTKAHNRDFTELAAPALLAALERHPNLRLIVAGHLKLDDRFAAVKGQVHRLDFLADVEAYWEVLAGIDVNLAVLAPGPTTDAKSEIKWLEAAACAVPSIVSATRTYREILIHGEDAMLVETAQEWGEALERLIADPDLRRRIGLNARAKARARYGLDAAAKVLATFLPPPAPDAERARPQRRPARIALRPRPRLLLTHVFFPPHLVGGATRVVRDNVDYLIDHAREAFDLAIVASDAGVETPYRTRIDAYRDVPVYRIAAPRQAHMDWRPFDPEMRAPFEAILDRFDPDLVHVHCVQNLTATVVEAVQARAIPYLVSLHDAWWISDFQFLLDGDDQLRLPGPDPLVGGVDPAHGLFRSVARRRRLAQLLEGARARLAVSEAFATLHREAGFADVRALTNGVSPFAPLPRRPGRDGRVRLGHVGNRSAHKGATLVEAVLRRNRFSNLSLTMIEHGREAGYRRDEVWGTTPVRIVGPVAQERIAELYAELDVLLAPSLWPESYGLVSREARAAGLWVVASDRGAIGEDIEEGIDGNRVDVSDGEGLRAALRRIEEAPARYRTPLPPPAKPQRSSDDQGADLLALYRSLLDEGRRDRLNAQPERRVLSA